MTSITIIGGGAAGFFCALSIKDLHPNVSVTIIEQQKEVLQKVKISGGGRCNVTHACFDVKELATFYPRGGKALIGMFSRFEPADTMKWFERRGVRLKIERDGRVFPVTDSSQTIIDCFLGEAHRLGIRILTQRRVASVSHNHEKNGSFWVTTSDGETISSDRLVLATGGSRFGHGIADALGHRIVPPVPSLFTFTIADPNLRSLAGVSIGHVVARVAGSKLRPQNGALLVTHWGLSGPAIIKLSAWGAIELAKNGYRFDVILHLLPDWDDDAIQAELRQAQHRWGQKKVRTLSAFPTIPQRFWEYLCETAHVANLTWKQLTPKHLQLLLNTLTALTLPVVGKSNFKEEFVTAGGVDLKEIDPKTMESKHCPGLYFAGEILNIDGVTGGFNFQNAWTTGFLIGSGFSSNY